MDIAPTPATVVPATPPVIPVFPPSAGRAIRKRCRRMKPSERWEFFSPSGQGRKEFHPDICDHQLRMLAENHSRAGIAVCSATWHDNSWDGAEYPPGGVDETLMVMSRARVGTGYCVKPHYRWTPPQCRGMEDRIDLMDAGEAARMGAEVWPASPSAKAIQLHAHYAMAAMMRAADDRGRIGRGISLKGSKLRGG
jgi:hypothetical protein